MKVKSLSGGEKRRVALCRLLMSNPDMLLLDEPTNHLDLEMVHALTVALQAYEGALIVVSHDRHLLANTVDEFYSIHLGVFSEFKGDLHDYEKWLNQQAKLAAKSSSGFEEPVAVSKPKLDKKEQRQLAAAKREKLAPLKKMERSLESTIDRNQQALDKIEIKLAEETIYDEGNKMLLTELLQKQRQLKVELSEAEEKWLETHEQLAQI